MSKNPYPPLSSIEGGFIRREHFRALLGNPSVATFYEWIQQGILPQPKKCGPRMSMWAVADVQSTLKKINAGQAQEVSHE